jgi:hypothetical protein
MPVSKCTEAKDSANAAKRLSARLAANAANMEARSNPILKVGKWELRRFDSNNFIVTDNYGSDNRYLYYPNLDEACLGFLQQQLNEAKGGDIASLRREIIQAKADVLAAIGKAKIA